MLPDLSALMRFLVAVLDDCEAGVEQMLWDAVQEDLSSVYQEPHLESSFTQSVAF